jgi:ketosteroid isomerase-like protein
MSEKPAEESKRAQVYALIAAVNARDFEAVSRLPMHPDFEFRSLYSDTDSGIHRGVDGLREWASNVDSTFADYRIEVGELKEADDERVVVAMDITGTGTGSGLPVDAHIGQVWTWRDGLLWRVDAHNDLRDALEAVGIRE